MEEKQCDGRKEDQGKLEKTGRVRTQSNLG